MVGLGEHRAAPTVALAHGVALALSLLSSVAKADDVKVVVLPVYLDGELADSWRAQLQRGVAEGLRRGGHGVVEPDAVLRTRPDAASCRDEACAAAIADALDGDYVLRTSIAIEDRDFAVRLELLEGATGAVVAETGESCEVCAVPEVAQLLAEHAAIVGAKIDALDRAPPVVEFRSRPAGALVYLDGELLGRAPVQHPVPVGRHRVRAQLRGHLTLEQPLEATPGTRETLMFELAPTPRRERLRPWGWALLGLSVPIAATGVTLLALDERPYRRRCSGDYVDALGNCRLRYDTLTGGIVGTSVGVAGLVAATTLLVLSRPETRRTGARLRVHPGPVTSVVGRF